MLRSSATVKITRHVVALTAMSESVLIVSQSGDVTPGLSTLLSAHVDGSVETTVTDRSEDGQYYLSPATVDRLESRFTGDEKTVLVVDGDVHPGQALDLRERLPVTVRDRRSALWEQLGETNPVAATRFDLRQCRIDRLAAARADRNAAAGGPSDSSGRETDLERRRDSLRDQLDERRQTASERVTEGYEEVDSRVVLVGRPGVATAALWATLTGDDPDPVGHRAQPTTATATFGPHTVAVTETPGVPGDGLPSWVEAVLPGLVAAVEQATLVIGVGPGVESLIESIKGRVDATCRQLDEPAPDAVRQAVAETLGTVAYRLQLPYDDATHALVADLHDNARVHDVAYRDEVVVQVEVSASRADAIARRVAELGGEVNSLDDSR